MQKTCFFIFQDGFSLFLRHTAYMQYRRTLSLFCKYATAVCALGGVLLSLICAKRDGYSHWSRRLLYFTAQSNIWLGLTFIAVLRRKDDEKAATRLYILKYIFTVSITVTGLVFCALLAPFSDKSYRPWTLCNILTHIFSPVFAVLDLFLDQRREPKNKGLVFLSLVPPFVYCIFAGILGTLGVDFGRGTTYPYFFLYFRSPVGLFGFSNRPPFVIGSFYWILIFLTLVLALAIGYMRRKRR